MRVLKHTKKMVDFVLKEICERAIGYFGREIDDLYKKIAVLNQRKDEWVEYSKDVEETHKPKRARKNQTDSNYHDEIEDVIKHCHLYKHAPFCGKHGLEYFRQRIGKTIQVKIYCVNQWNDEFHTTTVEGPYVVQSVEEDRFGSERVHLRHVVEKKSSLTRIKKSKTEFHYHHICPDLHLYYASDDDIRTIYEPGYNEKDEMCSSGQLSGDIHKMICIGCTDE